jgi:transposase-like protein
VCALVSPVSALLEHVAELLAERGVEVDASCIWRWVQAYAPELNNAADRISNQRTRAIGSTRPISRLKARTSTCIERSTRPAQTIEFLLMAKRDKHAAKRFLVKAIDASGNPMPRVINVQVPQ